jgi:nicotinate-nucleotide adenylyltransferase
LEDRERPLPDWTLIALAKRVVGQNPRLSTDFGISQLCTTFRSGVSWRAYIKFCTIAAARQFFSISARCAMHRLCFGGTFNPIHHGHLICAAAVAERAGFDNVVLIPANHPPHKSSGMEIAPPEQRLAMCRLATAGSKLFEVDGLELDRSGPSYTLDTVREFRQRGWPEVHWLIGADMLLSLPQWHEAEALLRETQFVVMARAGWEIDWQRLPPPYRVLEKSVIHAPMIDISATDIRRRVAEGRSIDYLTPAGVAQYIRSTRLYSKS